MKKDYIWTFNSLALVYGLNGPFSLDYNIPGSKMAVSPEGLVDSRIWLVVKNGDENFLYAFLSPSVIEIYQEGKYQGDFLLQCAPFSSIRLLPRQGSTAPWRLSLEVDEGIRECTENERAIFFKMVKDNSRVGFAPPSRAILESVPRTTFSDLEHAVPDQLISTIRTCSFGDTPRPRSLPDSVSALGGIALSILKSTRPDFNVADVVSLLAELDPLGKMDERLALKSTGNILQVLSSLPPVVDTFLEEIDPDKIVPRTFVARSMDVFSDWLDKTNDAEETHERILKDVVLQMKNKGFQTLKSRSFDLFTRKSQNQILWEIKSADSNNSVSQGEKGIVQLLRYATAMSDGKFKGIKFILLIQYSEQPAVVRYLSKMADQTGAEVWLYDAKRNWPERIFSLEKDYFLGL